MSREADGETPCERRIQAVLDREGHLATRYQYVEISLSAKDAATCAVVAELARTIYNSEPLTWRSR